MDEHDEEQPRVSIKLSLANRTALAEITGELDLYRVSSLKADLIHALESLEEPWDTLIADLGAVHTVDSSGVAMLANLQRRLEEDGREFFLQNLTRKTRDMLRMSMLDRLLKIKE